MRPRVLLRKPAILTLPPDPYRLSSCSTRHHHDVVCGRLRRSVSGTTFLAGRAPATPGRLFAIGVAALFGAACGAIGICISRIRQMKAELRQLEARLELAADRNWEISEAQERAKSFFEAQGDVIVRRDAGGAITYVNDAFCALAGRASRGSAGDYVERCRCR